MTDLSAVRANVEVLQYCKKRMAELKEMQEQSRAIVEEALGEHESGTLDGEEVIAFKHLKQRRLNHSKLRELYPEVAESCTDTTELRRFEVK